MIRTLTLLVIAIALFSNTYGQVGEKPRPESGFSGQIHTLRHERYNCTGDPAEKPWRVDEWAFDRQGNKTYQAYFNADGSVGHQSSYKFNDQGVQTGWAEFYGKSELPPAGRNKHADFTLAGGRIISSVVYKENEPEFRTKRDYDERGNLIREVTVQIGCCTTTRTFEYDAQNRMVENTYDLSGRSSIERRTYDTAGNLTQESHHEKGVLIWSKTREFEGKRLLKEVSNSGDRRVRTTTNTYNKNGDLVRIDIDDVSILSTTTIDYYPNGKMRSQDKVTVAKVDGPRQHSEATPTPGRILEKYDSSGNETEWHLYDDKGALYFSRFSSYDEMGRQIGLVEKSTQGPMYNRDLIYRYDSRGNRVISLCRSTTGSGEVNLSLAEKKVMTYHDN